GSAPAVRGNGRSAGMKLLAEGAVTNPANSPAPPANWGFLALFPGGGLLVFLVLPAGRAGGLSVVVIALQAQGGSAGPLLGLGILPPPLLLAIQASGGSDAAAPDAKGAGRRELDLDGRIRVRRVKRRGSGGRGGRASIWRRASLRAWRGVIPSRR